jgi:hypothetical protein
LSRRIRFLRQDDDIPECGAEIYPGDSVSPADLLGCTPNQLTGLGTARFATGMDLAMRIAQWIGRPAADFVYPATW